MRHRHNTGTMLEQHHIADPMLRQRLYTIVLSPAPYLHTDTDIREGIWKILYVHADHITVYGSLRLCL